MGLFRNSIDCIA